MIMCRVKCNDRFEKTVYVFKKKESFTWLGTTYEIDPTLCYRTRGPLYSKVFALDYSKGNPKPIDYFNAAPGGVSKDFQLTPDLVAETYRQIISGVDPKLILICVILAIVVAGVAGFLAYYSGEQTKNALDGIRRILQNSSYVRGV